ncbi:protein-glutamate methylesterase/protein-glutamine glutaminase [Microvirga mediterraneensis]|uniref:Protein-glutamate methylesterase/protein-glutamine glutaminase n=1 Tax=Microvirga mediterraneensis TaxID=2754695 RepID=A0A838BGL7_9HYPH|nr:chemotaxis response regulator protein-glutamate methylesterase [Microvirga mediterraneensis]MBA1154697.1 chemotaxis response regulator protein-glutamate methylesterase [Microvirga mediterraneensis]
MVLSPVTQTIPVPGRLTRVMIVDDSAVIRGMIGRWLTEAGGFEIVATASNGRMAVDAAARAKPEIILLDLEMPEVDGLAALPLILKAHPASKVIVISTLTQRNAEISLKCLSLGAIDYLAKPESARVPGAANEFRRELVEKMRALSETKARPARVPASPAAKVISPMPPAPPRLGGTKPQCLLIGSSTGGPRAVERVLLDMKPALSRIPVLIVQHMPAMFTAVFADHLQTLLSIPSREARDGDAVAPGTILVAPGGRHMGVVSSGGKAAIRLNDGPPENFCRPAVDVLFREAAAVYGASALAVVLTGMGSDGTHGARHLAKAGATVIAQDEATSIVWGMPGSIVKAGLAHEVLPLESIGRSLKGLITGAST